MELLDLVARTRRQVGAGVCLEEGGKEGGFGDGELCGRHDDWVAGPGRWGARASETVSRPSRYHGHILERGGNDLTK